MANHTLSHKLEADGESLTYVNTFTGGLGTKLDEAVADSETDKQIVVAIDVSEIASLFLVSDQDVTVETNSGSSPDDTISLKADRPLTWNDADGYYSCPLTVDVTSLFITNASGSTANIKGRFVTDPTP